MIDRDKQDRIDRLDLKGVKEKLRREKGWFWCWRNDLKKLEREYRKFLCVAAANPGSTVVPPTQAVDDFWHAHILDTRKYREDCATVFGAGQYFHHNPHMPKGSLAHTSASRDTKRMYREAYPSTSSTYAAGAAAVGCGSSVPSKSACGSSDSNSSSDGGSSCGGSSSSCGGGCGGGGGN